MMCKVSFLWTEDGRSLAFLPNLTPPTFHWVCRSLTSTVNRVLTRSQLILWLALYVFPLPSILPPLLSCLRLDYLSIFYNSIFRGCFKYHRNPFDAPQSAFNDRPFHVQNKKLSHSIFPLLCSWPLRSWCHMFFLLWRQKTNNSLFF